jgi:acyl phosphate:glycerol-3-phosphate acyltransferase
MAAILPWILTVLGGYVCGATPFGYLAGRLKGVDIREHGSGNIGATNVVRTLGKGVGIPVFLLDVLKGWLPAWLALGWFTSHGYSVEAITAASILGGVAAVIGHSFTFWLKGKGGKGIATSCGALLGPAPLAIFVAAVIWFVCMKLTRYVSLASIVAAISLPITLIILMQQSGQWNGVLLGFATLLSTLAVVRHRSNIQRLLAGTENKVGAPKA